MIAASAEPGVCTIYDAWIVSKDGQVHPGYDESIVPFRLEDVCVEDGRHFDGPEPEEHAKYGVW